MSIVFQGLTSPTFREENLIFFLLLATDIISRWTAAYWSNAPAETSSRFAAWVAAGKDAYILGDVTYVVVSAGNVHVNRSEYYALWGDAELPAGRGTGGLWLLSFNDDYRGDENGIYHVMQCRFPLWPLWLLPLLFVAFPAAFWWWRDRRRFPPGQCQRCGYNLTGNLSGVCPECGTAVPEELLRASMKMD